MPNHEHKEEETERMHTSTQQMPGMKHHFYNTWSESSYRRNWMTDAVRATGFFQDTEYFSQYRWYVIDNH
jgi:hypothetical protein